MKQLRVMVYADVNLNLLDGSAIWAQSITEVLAAVPGVHVSLLLKAPIETDRLIAPLLDRANITVVKPFEDELLSGLRNSLSYRQVGHLLAHLDSEEPYDAFIIRGSALAAHLARLDVTRGRMWTYLTDIPQSTFAADPNDSTLESIGASSRVMLVQTEDLRTHMEQLAPSIAKKTVLWPPVVAEPPAAPRTDRYSGGPIKLVYTGKMASHWRTEEMTRLPSRLHSEHDIEATLDVIGDKIHNEPSDPDFADRMRAALKAERVNWHGGLPRLEAMRRSADCHVGLGWRSPELDASLELSTKVLEFGSMGLPVVLNRTPAHESLLGADYPLFANDEDEVVTVLAAVANDPEIAATAAERTLTASGEHLHQAAVARMTDALARLRPTSPDSLLGETRRVLVAGHDLKFIDRLIEELSAFEELEIEIDHWAALAEHDPEASKAALERTDVVLCEWCGPNAIWYSEHVKPEQRLIVRLHRFELYSGYPKSLDINNVDQVITVDPHYRELTRNTMTGWPKERIVALPNWVDTSQLHRPKHPGARFNLGMIGIAPRRKRLDLALDILSAVRAVDPRFTLHIKTKMPWDYWWIWKDPAEREHYKEALQRVQTDPLLLGAVTFDQFGADVASWLRKIGCVLSTSDDESFHLSPAEGMASGATSVVLPWAGADEVYGSPWVVSDIEEAAQRVLEQADPEVWEERRVAAMEHVAPYDLAEIVGAWADIIMGNRDHTAWP